MGSLARPSVRIGIGLMEALLNRGQRPGALKILSSPYCLIGMHILAGTNSVLAAKKRSSNMLFPNLTSLAPNMLSETPSGKSSPDNIIWVDCEMTGLNSDKDHIMEIACLVTDSQLNIIAEGPDITVYQPPAILDKMNEWSLKQHKESGLTEQCEKSEVTLREAEKQLVEFVRKWTPFKKCPLAGNTIYMDRMFLKKHMPEFEDHMHYRIIDVSSVKELCSRWYPDVYSLQPNKKDISKHRAMDDIKNSVQELQFYKDRVFLKPSSDSCAFE